MTAFGDAFKAAKSAGKTTFKFGGKSYHTKTKDEMTKTKKAVPTPTPRPTNSDDSTNAGQERFPAKKPQQDYPRPAKDVGIARAGSAIGQAAARADNAPVTAAAPKPAADPAWKPRSSNPTSATPADKQGPKPEEGQWFAAKGSAISLAIARRRNAPKK